VDLTIIEVTEMGSGVYCVAGWSATDARMVRPLPNGANWTMELLTQIGVVPGAIIRVEGSGKQSNSAYPHRTEDFPVDRPNIGLLSHGPGVWFGRQAPPLSETLAGAFEGNVRRNSVWNGCLQGVHVLAGAKTRSLWAVKCNRRDLSFIEEFDKLKCRLYDGNATYKLPVSSRLLKEAWRRGGLTTLTGTLPNGGMLHVRVGLARAFENQPEKCYIMVNDIHW
jgi:hypothetical protein